MIVNTPFAGPEFVGPFDYTGTATLTYPTDQVDLVLGAGYAILAAPPGAGQNQQNVVTAIDSYITSGGALPPGFANLGNLSGPAYLNALTELDGEDATGAQTSAFQLMTQFLDLMSTNRRRGRRSGGSGASGFADEAQANLPPDVALAYARALHKNRRRRSKASTSAGAPGARASAAPAPTTATPPWARPTSRRAITAMPAAWIITSRRTPFTALRWPAAAPTGIWRQVWAAGAATLRARRLCQDIGARPICRARWRLCQSLVHHQSHRGFGDQLTANFQGQSYAARGEAGYRYAVPLPGYIIGVTPYAALQVQDFHTPGYSETDLTGGGFGLTYASVNATDTRSELGARFDNLTVWTACRSSCAAAWPGRMTG